jgi:transcription termination factor Rho
MSEPQLERSVLEAKEREELYAIADALGTKPGSRAKKADLIAQILKATGVDDGDPPEPVEKPRRTRARKAVSEPATATATAAPEAGERAEAQDVAPPAPVSPSRSRAANGKAAALRAAETAELETPPPAVEAGEGRDSAPPRPDPGTNGSEAAAVSTSTDRQDRQDHQDHQDHQEHQDRARGGAAQAQPAGQPHQGAPANQGGQPQHTDRPTRFDAEPGNRRNRRRRGRERGDRPGPERTERSERDLPGQGAEQQFVGEPIPVKGFLDLRDEGYGFLRTKGFLAGPNDIYVSISQVRRFALRKGDEVEGASRPAASNEKYPALLRMDTVNGLTPDEARTRPKFEDLTALFPDEKMRLEVPGDPANMTARIVDLISPIGKGQRGLIVSPPKAGKTTVLKQIAHSIEANNPEVHLMVLLVAERPEEVTDMRRSVKGEVIASTFDRPSDEHTQVAELAIERAKRLVEMGRDVVIVLDGITRLARAYNLAQPATGRIMSGGLDTGALYPPKKFFGSARNIEEGGSLTILATALVETGSRMDEVIFEEFKGTGNMELRLDRRLAERRIYPALDVNASSTRHEELLFDRTQLQQVWKLRRVLNALGSEGSDAAGLQLLMDKIKSTRSNDEFLAEIAKTPTPAI